MFGLQLLSIALAATGCNPQNNNPTDPPPPTSCNSRQEASSSGSALQTVRGKHIPRIAEKFKDRGKRKAKNKIDIAIAFKLNNEAELLERLQAVYNPASPEFHKYITPQEFRDRYGATPTQIKEVENFLKAQGIEPKELSANALVLRARGDTSVMSSAFAAEIHDFVDEKGNSYFAPRAEPTLPSTLQIQAVHGLHNITRWSSHAQQLEPIAHAGTGPAGGFTPSEIRKAYQVPSSVDGAGQTLALFELDGFTMSDINTYQKQFSLPNIPIQTVLVDGFNGKPGSGAGEVTLDIQLQMALAPGASKIIVYEAPNTELGVLDLYNRIASDNIAQQISTSWGAPEAASSASFLQTEGNIFRQMALQGQTIYAAAGDSGAFDNGSTLSVDDPASQPYMIGVGGTRLSTSSSGSYVNETVWNAGSAKNGAGGGGISTIWTQPTWQKGAISQSSLGSTQMRNVPDVALNSDPATGYAIYFQGRWVTFGGTSCASPLWAAYTALVNQKRAKSGLGRLGFASPIFYKIGQSNRYDLDFFDIADGSTNLKYPAVKGYDNATGWGSFKGDGLFDDLSTDASSAVVDPLPSPLPSTQNPPTTQPGC